MDNVVTAVCFLFLLKLKWPKNKNMRKGEMQMEEKKNVQTNLLNLEQIDWQPNLSIKEKK